MEKNKLEEATNKVAPIFELAAKEAEEKRKSYGLFLTEESMKRASYYEEGFSATLEMISLKFASHPSNVSKESSASILEHLEKEFPSYSRNIAKLEPITLQELTECIKNELGCDIHKIRIDEGEFKTKGEADYWNLLTTYYKNDIRNGADIGINMVELIIPRLSLADGVEEEILNNSNIPNEILEQAQKEVEIMNDPVWKMYVHKALNTRYPDRIKDLSFRLKVSW